MASGENFPINIEPAFFTSLINLLLNAVHNSKCSGAIILIISEILFLLFVYIANPNFLSFEWQFFFWVN